MITVFKGGNSHHPICTNCHRKTRELYEYKEKQLCSSCYGKWLRILMKLK